MSFKRLEPEDFLLSTDSIIAGAFAGGTPSNTANGDAINAGVSAEYFSAFLGSDGQMEVSLTFGKSGSAGTSTENAIYNQFANIIQGEATTVLPVGSSFTALVVERSRFKQSIFPDSFRWGSDGLFTGSTDVGFTNAGRVFSGSNDLYLYPDIGVALKNESSVTSLPTSISSGDFTVHSEEVITSNYVFIRARNAEFNYSQNPTFIDSTTGGVRFSEFITSPQTFITTVGLYNDNGDLLAVAKLSKPLKKDFTKEALIRIKLDF